MPKPRSQWALGALAVTAVGVVTFGILELVLRLSVGDAYASLYRPDPRTHYRLSPGGEKVFQHPAAHGGGRIRVAINRDGFRGDELLPLGAARRVVVYGDSYIAGEYSSLENTFVERLEDRLTRDLGEPVEAVNAGVVGYGPDQVLLRMQAGMAELRPELVIVAVYAGNDFGDLLRNKLFERGSAGELIAKAGRVEGPTASRLRWSAYSPVLYKIVARAYYNWTHRPPSAEGDDPAEAQSRQIEEWLKERQTEWQSANSGELAVTNLLRDTPDVDIATAPQSDSAQYKLALMELVLTSVRDTAARAGIPLLLLIVPSPMDACDHYPLAHVDPARFSEYRPERATGLLLEIAERLEIPRVDLFAAFRRYRDCGLFFPADAHWNNAGQELAAALTADAIAAAELLPRREGLRDEATR